MKENFSVDECLKYMVLAFSALYLSGGLAIAIEFIQILFCTVLNAELVR